MRPSLLIVVLLVGACSLDRTIGEGQLSCSADEPCPPGYHCADAPSGHQACYSGAGSPDVDAVAANNGPDGSGDVSPLDALAHGGAGGGAVPDGGDDGPAGQGGTGSGVGG